MCRVELRNLAGLAGTMQKHETQIDASNKFEFECKTKRGMAGADIALTLISDTEGAAGERLRTPMGNITPEEYQTILDRRVTISKKALSDAGVHVEYPPQVGGPELAEEDGGGPGPA